MKTNLGPTFEYIAARAPLFAVFGLIGCGPSDKEAAAMTAQAQAEADKRMETTSCAYELEFTGEKRCTQSRTDSDDFSRAGKTCRKSFGGTFREAPCPTEGSVGSCETRSGTAVTKQFAYGDAEKFKKQCDGKFEAATVSSSAKK